MVHGRNQYEQLAVEVNDVSARLTAILAVLMCLSPWLASAEENSSFPGVSMSKQSLRVHDQAEEVYQRTDYERAFFIYRNELAPVGDKYGQYMVGFMYVTGKGVDEDVVAGSAWYRLAAERGTKEYVRTRDVLMHRLDADQKSRSDQLFIDIRSRYGDLALLMKAIRKDYALLRNRTVTGSRVASDATMVMSVDGAGQSVSRQEYYGQVERRIRARLEYIERFVGTEIIDENISAVNLASVEQQVNDYLSKID